MAASTNLTPEQRSLRSRMAAHKRHAHSDPLESTKAARAAADARFAREADPDGVLPPDERARRAGHLRQAYMLGLALKSSKARSKRAST